MGTKALVTSFLLTCIFLLSMAGSGHALPRLQIYIPGAFYDVANETWVINAYEYDLWVVGAKEEILDVKLALATPSGEEGSISLTWLDPDAPDYGTGDGVPTIQFTRNTAMAYGEYRASYAQGAPGPATFGFARDATPLMGDGTPLPPHGVFPGNFFEYYIGNFGTNGVAYDFSPPEGYSGDTYTIDDFNSLPKDEGEIKKFHISVEGFTWLDIVAYDHYVQSNDKAHYVFTPFSHDGGEGAQVPEPATFLLLGCGCLALGRILKERG